MKILIPTDFSKTSVNAAEYGAGMAVSLNAKVLLLHVVYIKALPHASTLNAHKFARFILDEAKQEIALLASQLKRKYSNLSISTQVINEIDVTEVIEYVAVEQHVNLIIMGTKGASGLTKLFVGSNTAAVVSNSNIPVLAVPNWAKFNGMKNIIYASDLLSVNEEIRTLIPMAHSFNAGIRLLHVVSPGSDNHVDRRKLTRELVSRFKYAKISVHFVYNNDIEEGMQEYLASLNVDLIVMFTHHLSTFEKIFNRSKTREMAFQSRVPLLAFKKPGVVELERTTRRAYAMD